MAGRALADQQSRIISVNRDKLLEVLKSNRIKHEADYIAAVAGYKETAAKQLTAAHEAAKVALEKNFKRGMTELEELDLSDPDSRSDHIILVAQASVHLEVPRSYVDQYDAAIAQVEWDVRDNLELTSAEFQCFVRNIWAWSDNFQKMSMAYTAHARR